MSKKKELAVISERSLFFDVEMFEHAQRIGKMFAASTMVPEHFRNNIGNCVIALNYAHRAKIDPFMTMQKMYIIHGKPAIETQLQIALFNKSTQFTTLKFNLNTEKTTCTAYATEKTSGEVITGPEVSIEMAKKEGWYSKKGSKWQTMPELMLRYRAAAFFIRLYAPETTLGLYTSEEMTDVIDITPTTPQQEIEEKANTVILDIQPEPEPSETQGEEPAKECNGNEMSDSEKEEIVRQEIIDSEEGDGPGF